MAYYKISVLEIGYDPKFPAGIAFDFWHMGDKQVYSPFSMTLLEGEGHKILFDCGFDPKDPFVVDKIKLEGDQNCQNPETVLSGVGLTPDDIDTVIINHCHWDHANGVRFFPNAKVYLQRDELENWERVLSDPDFPSTYKTVIDPDTIELLDRMGRDGRLSFLEGDLDDFLPGIHVRSARGHSFAQTMLLVENTKGGRSEHYAVIGDVSMRPESFKNNDMNCYLPNLKFAVGSIEDIMKSYHVILNWVNGDIQHIVMSHDGTRCGISPTTRNKEGLNISVVCD